MHVEQRFDVAQRILVHRDEVRRKPRLDGADAVVAFSPRLKFGAMFSNVVPEDFWNLVSSAPNVPYRIIFAPAEIAARVEASRVISVAASPPAVLKNTR